MGPKELPDFADSTSARQFSPAENSLCDYFPNSEDVYSASAKPDVKEIMNSRQSMP